MKISPAGKAWVGLALFVILADYLLVRNGHDTMSTAFGRAILDPQRRWPVLIAWAYLTIHLNANLLNRFGAERFKRYDPLGQLANHIPRRHLETLTVAAQDFIEALDNASETL
jgi:hypothetical protein